MEELIKNNLENGEKILWTGKSASKKVMDSTYLVPYLIRFVVSYGIVAALAFYAISKTGSIRTSALLMLLVVGSLIPMTAISDGIKSKKLCYAATDRRLMRVNESLVSSVNYDEIGSCAFRKDSSGNTSLLCGDKTVSSNPSSWRGKALFTGSYEKDSENHVNDYVFYAVDDAEGLKKAIEDKVKIA